MKIFLSWSGELSKHIAVTLNDWLPYFIQAVEPWISADIAKGQKWDEEITKGLKESKVCILCLTQDNLKSTFLHYEAGVIFGNTTSKNCTLLYEVEEKLVTNPLSSFQNTKFEKEDFYKLLQTINDALRAGQGQALKDNVLRRTFETNWDAFYDAVTVKAPKPKNLAPVRSIEDITSEILTIVRRIDNQVPLVQSNYNPSDIIRRRSTYPLLSGQFDLDHLTPNTKVTLSSLEAVSKYLAQLPKGQREQLLKTDGLEEDSRQVEL